MSYGEELVDQRIPLAPPAARTERANRINRGGGGGPDGQTVVVFTIRMATPPENDAASGAPDATNPPALPAPTTRATARPT